MSSSYSNTDKVTLLAAAYQAERSDNATIFTNTLAVLGFALAYVAAVLGFVSTATTLHGVLLAFAPMPACALIAYHQAMVGMNGARAAAAHRIERIIVTIIDDDALRVRVAPSQSRWQRITSPKPLAVGEPKFGIGLGEQFLDPGHASKVRALAAGLTYLFLLLGTIAFTAFVLTKAAQNDAGAWAVWGGAVCSGLLILIAVWNLALNGKRPEVKRAESV
ncbi:hypothetical protein [Lentzea flaviverrucosa]|uniref:Uncharacterized protein n=1 Tax=Lentzea flaviverrucosa TaxID=200379 RepID=A0A1H9SMK3_9PSEU|nr:hypothetical protein [Lentzea flaviverrucosa]RDI25430.1 hypothetical protein DFR72_108122 [Lentzea flaviverrucosa]SER85955.1 hypothetical protein SAMN05216195_107123 [Lentzea flaviverrucosa]